MPGNVDRTAVSIRDQAASLQVPSAYQNQTWTDALSGDSVSTSPLELELYGYRMLRAGQQSMVKL